METKPSGNEIKEVYDKLQADLTRERIDFAKRVAKNPADPNLGAQISRINNLEGALEGLNKGLSDTTITFEIVPEK